MPLVLSGDGAVGPLSATEVSYLDGVTSAVQTQINGKLTTPGAFTSFTPTVTCETGTITSYTLGGCSYSTAGKTTIAKYYITITNKGTGAGQLFVTLPLTANGNVTGFGVERGSVGFSLAVYNYNTTSVAVKKYDWTTVVQTNYALEFNVIYEAA